MGRGALESEKQEPLTLQDVEEDKRRLVEQAIDYWKRRAEKAEHDLMIARETIRADRKSLAVTEAQVARLADPALVDLLAAYADRQEAKALLDIIWRYVNANHA